MENIFLVFTWTCNIFLFCISIVVLTYTISWSFQEFSIIIKFALHRNKFKQYLKDKDNEIKIPTRKQTEQKKTF